MLLAALAVTSLLASARRAPTVAVAVVLILVLVGGLVVAGTSWSAGPFVGAAMAILAAAGMATLILRRSGQPRGAHLA